MEPPSDINTYLRLCGRQHKRKYVGISVMLSRFMKHLFGRHFSSLIGYIKLGFVHPIVWSRYELIAIDEVGYVPLADLGAEFLFQRRASRESSRDHEGGAAISR
jgi:hypothetical protein